MAPGKTSFVWKHFEKVSDKEVKCKICNDYLAYSGGTGTMVNHLKRHPTARDTDASNSTNQQHQSIVGFLTPSANKVCSNERSKQITDMILKMVIGDMLPIDFVSSQRFEELMAFVEPGYRIPCRQTATAMLEKMYEDNRQKLVNELKAIPHVALTTDCWTSLTTESYITVTCHFLTADWKLKSAVLTTETMDDERHTGENLAKRLGDIGSQWSLTDSKISGMVHDNASNIVLAAGLLQWPSLRCYAHTINLAIGDVFHLPHLSLLLKIGSRLVSHFNHSTVASKSKALANAQVTLDLPQHKLIQYCKTRWNSAGQMLERLLEQRWAISKVLSDRQITKSQDARALEIPDDSWGLIEDIIPILKSLETVSDVLCGELMCFKTLRFYAKCCRSSYTREQYPTASIILPITNSLLNKHLAKAESDSPSAAEMKEMIANSLRKRLKPTDAHTVKGPAALASLLDPRHKHLRFLEAQHREDVKQLLQSMHSSQTVNTNHKSIDLACSADDIVIQEPESKRNKMSMRVLLGDDYEDGEKSDEFTAYLQEPNLPIDSSALQWWQLHEHRFPHLATLARKFLCIPATSVPSERVFSAAGLLINRLRSRLSPEHVNVLTFLNKTV